MSQAQVDLVVVGAGVAGLVVAHDAAQAGMTVLVLEASTRVGGLLAAAELDGLAVDVGAESFATRTTGVVDLVRDARLDLRIVAPAPTGGAHLAVVEPAASDGILRAPLPRRTVLGIPADPLAADVVRILGEEGARRAAAETPSAIGEEPSLAELVAARSGDELVRRLVDPLCRSVYSVPAADLRLSRVQPALWQEFLARGTLREAAGAIATDSRAGAAVSGIHGGMWRLAAALRDAVQALGVEVRTSAPGGASHAVRSITPLRGGVEIVLDDARIRAGRTVVATGTRAARALLGAAGEAPAPATTVRVVAALVASAALDAHPVGSGVIVAADLPTAAKALTHVSAKWEWVRDALPAGHHVVRLSARDAGAGLRDAGDIAHEISLLTGVDIAAADVRATADARWTDAVAAPPVGVEAQQRLADDGILLVGAAVAGTGLASVVPHARNAARALAAPDPLTVTTPAPRRTA